MGLQNLAQMCHLGDKAERAAIVEGHFGMIERIQSDRADLARRIGHLDSVKDLLAVRIWPKSYLDAVSGQCIHREDLEGTITVLVFDLPTSIRPVSPKEANVWGKRTEELLQIGLDNVLRTCRPEIDRHDLGDGVGLVSMTGESHFVATHVLMLEHHSDCLGTYGALIGIPHRHAVLCHPIEDFQSVKAIQTFAIMIQGMEHEGPGSISPRLYWYRDGEFTDIPVEQTEQGLIVRPPDKFVGLLNELAERAKKE